MIFNAYLGPRTATAWKSLLTLVQEKLLQMKWLYLWYPTKHCHNLYFFEATCYCTDKIILCYQLILSPSTHTFLLLTNTFLLWTHTSYYPLIWSTHTFIPSTHPWKGTKIIYTLFPSHLQQPNPNLTVSNHNTFILLSKCRLSTRIALDINKNSKHSARM